MPTTRDALIIVVLFLIPGFISDGVLSKQFARQKREATELILNIILLTLVNYAIWAVISIFFFGTVRNILATGVTRYVQVYPGWSLGMALLFLFVSPVAEAALLGWLGRSERGRQLLRRALNVRLDDPNHPSTAWDFVFDQGNYYVLLLTLTDGSRVAGGFGGDSYATSYPHEQEVYLEIAYEVDTNGKVGEPLPLSAGVLVKRSEIRALEFYKVTTESVDEREEVGEAGNPDPTDPGSPGPTVVSDTGDPS